jgi:Na+-transporting methylmalonyl-CoA/oxaloacetate decarboxylase gamma subunit
MFVPTKLLFLVLLAFAVWYAVRVFNRLVPPAPRRRPAAPAGARAAVEDLTACRICGAYVAASARACGKPACPQPR